MKPMGKPAVWAFAGLICFAPFLASPVAVAQEPTPPIQPSEPPLPRNNVRGGAIAARRPGSWVQSGIATTSERINVALRAYGGVDYTQEGPPPSICDEVLPALADVFLNIIDQLSLIIQAIIQGNTIPAAT